MTVAKDSTISRCLHCGLLVSLAVLVTATSVAAAADDILECAKIEADDQRLACFDAVAEERRRRIESGEAEMPPSQQNAGTRAVTEEFELKAQVNRCEESVDGRYFFYLDNGQVWKQTRTDRYRYKDCNFSVTIIKDFFGHKMVTDDGERTVRVKLIR